MLQNTPKRIKSTLFCLCGTSSNVALALRPNPERLASMHLRARIPCVFISFGLILATLVTPFAQADQPPAPASELTDLLTREEFVNSGRSAHRELTALETALIRHQQLAGQATARTASVDNNNTASAIASLLFRFRRRTGRESGTGGDRGRVAQSHRGFLGRVCRPRRFCPGKRPDLAATRSRNGLFRPETREP